MASNKAFFVKILYYSALLRFRRGDSLSLFLFLLPYIVALLEVNEQVDVEIQD